MVSLFSVGSEATPQRYFWHRMTPSLYLGQLDWREQHVHQVTISRPFYLGTYEVTQRQWEEVMGSNPSSFTDNNTINRYKAAYYKEDTSRPVEMVSWDDVQQFIWRLNVKEGGTIYDFAALITSGGVVLQKLSGG
jgi:formylglycine-generating enzyme required for sulfatase activity